MPLTHFWHSSCKTLLCMKLTSEAGSKAKKEKQGGAVFPEEEVLVFEVEDEE